MAMRPPDHLFKESESSPGAARRDSPPTDTQRPTRRCSFLDSPDRATMRSGGKLVANLATRVWKGPNIVIAIVVQNTVAPTDAEWDSYARIVDLNIGAPNSHGLALTDGGGPSATQRAR